MVRRTDRPVRFDRHRRRRPGGAGMGADFGYIGSAFIATQEANATEAYKQAIVEGAAEDIVYTNLFTGVHGNYLRPSHRHAGLDPDNLPASDPSKMNFGSGGTGKAKAWRDIWGSGQGIGAVKSVLTAARTRRSPLREYEAAKEAHRRVNAGRAPCRRPDPSRRPGAASRG